MVNINRQSEESGDKWTMEKMRSDPCTVTVFVKVQVGKDNNEMNRITI